MFDRSIIRRETTPAVYVRARSLYTSDHVSGVSASGDRSSIHISGSVLGSHYDKQYLASATINVNDGTIIDTGCSCPSASMFRVCKHCAAMLLYYCDHHDSDYQLESSEFNDDVIAPSSVFTSSVFRNTSSDSTSVSGSGRQFATSASSRQQRTTSFDTLKLLRGYSDSAGYLPFQGASGVNLEPHVTLKNDKLLLEFKIGTSKKYIVKDVGALITAINEHLEISYSKNFSFVHNISAFDSSSRSLIAFLQGYFRERSARSGMITNNLNRFDSISISHKRSIELVGHEIDDFMKSVTDSIFYFKREDYRNPYPTERILQISYDMPELKLTIEGFDDGVIFDLSDFTAIEGYENIFFFDNSRAHMIRLDDLNDAIPFIRFNSKRVLESEKFIANNDIPTFVSTMLPILEKYFRLSFKNFEPDKYAPLMPEFRIYLDMPDENTITCDFQAIYDEDIVHIFSNIMPSVSRNILEEKRRASALSSYFNSINRDAGIMILSGSEDKIYDFISGDIAQLHKIGDVYLSDSIHEVNIIHSDKIQIGLGIVSDLLDLTVVSNELTNEDLISILNRYENKRKYYRLKNGTVVDIRNSGIEELSYVTDTLGIKTHDIINGHAGVPKYRAFYLDSLAESDTDINYMRDDTFMSLIKDMKDISDKTYDVPITLDNIMRDYQKNGFNWLCSLNANGFGGILADDMGLGKTLQVLSYLVFNKNKGCNLIVCPASLVYNWSSEIRKYTPELNYELAVGTKANRRRILDEISESKTNVIITSYDLLRRDIDMYKEVQFACEVIDEAQFIKNPGTQVARAVKNIKSVMRIALTGTPIENRLSELWSIFDYIMPGYLYSYKRFHDEFESRIIQNNDEIAMDHLRRLITPFILRRVKKDVLKDLPDKIEETVYVQLEDEQNQLYKARIMQLKNSLQKQSDSEFRTNKIAVLAELTRLRQLCCYPGLIYEDYDGNSAKEDLCIEMITSAAEGGHKVLLFSQFTSMLERLTHRLKKEGIGYHLLTGSTPKEERISLVNKFQSDDIPVFCISLKAGGTGLNLTAADIVIHYDPWWNVAVQNQATDRAHRIGQTNVVTVYKLIMKDTVEEKIKELQEKKTELADQLLSSENISSASFTREELLEILS